MSILRTIGSLVLNYQYTCLFTDHDGLFPKKDGKEKLLNEGEWAVKVAEHLLTKLAVDNNYVLTRYPKLPPDTLEECTGRVGDTSFGM